MVVSFPGQSVETWRVCRAHDRDLKLQAVRSRPMKPPHVEVPVPANAVRCGGCGQALEEPFDLPAEQRMPCPNCESTSREKAVWLADSLSFHSSLRARTKAPGKGGWMFDTQSGDDYTQDLDAWGRRELTKDRAGDLYREVIELWDGTRIESTARLRDHRD